MKARRKAKGQMSLEFLTTYGWAFLVALIAIGTLAYFGVLSPAKYTSNRCNFGPEISCKDFKLQMTGIFPGVYLRLTNNIGTSVIIGDVDVTNDASTPLKCPITWTAPTRNPIPCTMGTNCFNASMWPEGSSLDLGIGCIEYTGGFSKGDKLKVKVIIRYFDPKNGESYSHTVNGEIYAEVQ